MTDSRLQRTQMPTSGILRAGLSERLGLVGFSSFFRLFDQKPPVRADGEREREGDRERPTKKEKGEETGRR